MNRRTGTFRRAFLIGLAASLAVATLACRSREVQATGTENDARALQDFNNRIEKYVAIHHEVEAKYKMLHIKATHSGADIVKRQHLLADRIRAARGGAREADIFTPEIAAYFRRAIDSAYLANSEGISASLACVSPLVEARIKANDIYPETSDYTIMPPTILLHVPRLPQELEYRIVDRDLIIRDVEANLVVDIMRNAIKSLPEGVTCDD